jgi:hypothetical protein
MLRAQAEDRVRPRSLLARRLSGLGFPWCLGRKAESPVTPS